MSTAQCEVCGRSVSVEDNKFIEHVNTGKICYGSYTPVLVKKIRIKQINWPILQEGYNDIDPFYS